MAKRWVDEIRRNQLALVLEAMETNKGVKLPGDQGVTQRGN